uniref:Uncharacterized protein n=1 Tax=Haptolina brevifila TaxID=156173 RepID=A0A7S2HK40_9EUKA
MGSPRRHRYASKLVTMSILLQDNLLLESIHPPIRPSIIHPSIHLPDDLLQSFNLSIGESIHPSILLPDDLLLEAGLAVLLEEVGVVWVPGRHLQAPGVLDLLAQVEVNLRDDDAITSAREAGAP